MPTTMMDYDIVLVGGGLANGLIVLPHEAEIAAASAADSLSQVAAPMDGVVRSVDCTPGRQVRKGEQLLLLEAMKMEVVVAAPRDGAVEYISVKAGEVIRSGKTLVTLVTA